MPNAFETIRKDLNRQVVELQAIVSETRKEMARCKDDERTKADLEMRCLLLSGAEANLKCLVHLRGSLKEILE